MNMFQTFPPGPRWYVGLKTAPNRVGVNLVEGMDDSSMSEIGRQLGAPDVIYVFGAPVTYEEIVPAIEAMLAGTGPRLSVLFADRLASFMAKIVTVPPVEGIH